MTLLLSGLGIGYRAWIILPILLPTYSINLNDEDGDDSRWNDDDDDEGDDEGDDDSNDENDDDNNGDNDDDHTWWWWWVWCFYITYLRIQSIDDKMRMSLRGRLTLGNIMS